ncbi:MAG: hypothetical protein ACRYF0_16175 [Janthinobacterium lividum]
MKKVLLLTALLGSVSFASQAKTASSAGNQVAEKFATSPYTSNITEANLLAPLYFQDFIVIVNYSCGGSGRIYYVGGASWTKICEDAIAMDDEVCG